MIVYFDAAALEWRTIAELTGDKTAIEEICGGLDAHTDNQHKFNLPSRLIAKLFLYRAIYRGPAYAYANDVEFSHVSKNVGFWENVISAFYEKYSGIAREHERWIYEVNKHGRLINPITGRIHQFKKVKKGWEEVYSENDITNYPNQSFGAELMACARVHICKRLKEEGLYNKAVYPILTVHDSNLFDVVQDREVIVQCIEIVRDTILDIRNIWKERYGVGLQVPHDCEIKVGPTWADLVTVYKEGKNSYDQIPL